MVPMLLAEVIIAWEPIEIFNKGKMARSFSYIEDVATATISYLDKHPAQVRARKRALILVMVPPRELKF